MERNPDRCNSFTASTGISLGLSTANARSLSTAATLYAHPVITLLASEAGRFTGCLFSAIWT